MQPRAHKSKAKKTSPKKAAKKASPKKAVKKTNPKKATAKKLASSAGSVLSGGLTKIVNSIKGIGKPEPVTITW